MPGGWPGACDTCEPRVTTAYAACDMSDARACAHLDQVRYLAPDADVVGCPQCIASGGRWVHLRMCQVCGQIGCCDSSPNRHATAHYEETRHPIVRSLEPREHWSWCYEDELLFRLDK